MAFDDPSGGPVHTTLVDLVFDDVRHDARFGELVRRVERARLD